MAIVMPTQGPEQNGAVTELLALRPEPDSDVVQVLEETLPPPAAPDQEIDLLKAEHAALRCTVEELEKLLEEKVRAEQGWIEKQKELESLVEDKSEVIRELHLKMQERPPAASR